MRMLIATGGTGGHIYPAMALADAAKERYGDIEILFVGNDDRMEASEVPSHGYAFQGLHASGLTGNVFNKCRALLLMMNCLGDAHHWSENTCWIFDADFEYLCNDSVVQLVCTGARCRDYKLRLLMAGVPEERIVCEPDEFRAAELLRDVTIPHMTYGIAAEADLFARDIEITENGVSFELRLRNAEYIQINLRMTGMFNVYNALSAAACALILGVSPENVRAGLESIHSVPGRIEMLPTNTPYRVILDYAHAPDALSNILRTCRTFTKKRLIALFGCGGDRDKGKRPIMGRIGGELADLCILTSDNPRTEDPMEILREIEEGIKETTGEYVVIENRRDAIRHALEIGREGDIIVLCGKGHETYQETMGVKRPFDEKVVVQELLTELRGE